MRLALRYLSPLSLVGFAWASLAWPALAVEPLPRAHAHNDYEHPRPLLDALAQGFCSVEADVYLVEGKLLVAHDLSQVAPERTLQKLYLDPLRERVKQHGGSVYAGAPAGFTLLVDIKSEAEPTYIALDRVLAGYEPMLTRFDPEGIKPGAVTVIISGNRPIPYMTAQTSRRAAVDGRLPDLATKPAASLVPLVSDHWGRQFRWNGDGPFPEAEREKLREWVTQAHDQGRRLRFWAVPDRVEAWRVLHEAGVDLINTDDLQGLATFLRDTAEGSDLTM